MQRDPEPPERRSRGEGPDTDGPTDATADERQPAGADGADGAATADGAGTAEGAEAESADERRGTAAATGPPQPAVPTAGPSAPPSGESPSTEPPSGAAPEPSGAAPEPSGPPRPPRRDARGNLVLSTSSSAVLIGVLSLLAAGVLVHLGMVFLHVAPPNTVSRQYEEAIDGYIYPEFEQNWKLFAPNPLQHNIAVHARVETRGPSGERERGDWVDLTAFDAEDIRGNLLPSHTAQNELRRAWDFFTGSHDAQNEPTGPRGLLSETYVKRIAMLRLAEHKGLDPSTVQRIQLRSATTPVQPPPWSGETVKDETKYRTLHWLPVTGADVPEAAR